MPETGVSSEGEAHQEIHAALAIRRLDALDAPAAELLRATNFVVVCTLTKTGSVHATPMWVDTDGEHVLLNTEEGRAWVRNLGRDDRVTCTVVNHAVPYEFVEIRGRALLPTRDGADAQADHLARKYLELDEYPYHDPNSPRVLIRVVPEKVVHMSPPLDGALPDALDAAAERGGPSVA